MGDVVVLERPVFGVSEAAGFLGLRSSKVRRWLDGYERHGTIYPPVVREQSTGSDIVTWGEYVELRYLKEYRANDVSLQRLRGVIDRLRDLLGTPYPLASAKAFVHNQELVWRVQEDEDLPLTLAVVVRTGEQLGLGATADRFLTRVHFDENDDIDRVYPDGTNSPVIMDPLRRFGRPTVHGISTDRLWELSDAGEPLDWIAEIYDLDLNDLRQAVAYENARRSLPA